MDTDRNLLFGVLALQLDLLDRDRFVEACAAWATRKGTPLADFLVERGWLTPEDKTDVERLLQRNLTRHGGDARAGLAAATDDVKRSLAGLEDPDIQRSLAGLACAAAPDACATIDYAAAPPERYRLTRLHATGGIGRVWLASDDGLGREVALKELRPEGAANATLWARFVQEARITGQLEHPGIVPVYELVPRPANRPPFYTMRFVRGRTLTEAARAFHHNRQAGRDDPLELPTLLNAFVTVCNTVAYAHSRGILHRDLKGQNVVLGDFGEVVLLDWGLAKRIDRPAGEAPASVQPEPADSGSGTLTVHGQAVGTPAYMAPEQAAGRLDLLGPRTDVYGLGAILYEILTGRPPFAGADTQEVLRKVRQEAPDPPRQVWAEVPPGLEAVCLQALTKDPPGRYATATDMAHAVQGWQEVQRRQAEEALRASEALYHSLVETLPLSVWRKDLHGRFTFANQRFCDSVGRTLDEVLGKTDFDFFPSELAAKYQRDDAHVHRTGTPLAAAEEHVTARGDKLYVEVVKTPIVDARGEVIGTQGIFWDVTERKRAEEELRDSRERYELAVLGSLDGLWDWDVASGAVYFSPRYKAMLGYAEDEFPNRVEEWESRLHPDDREGTLAALHAHLEGRTPHYEAEYRLRQEDGSFCWIRARGVALRTAGGKPYRMAGSHEDITERKRLEEALRHANAELECLRRAGPAPPRGDAG
jgi:PAS domain S-box-containing protein